MNKEPRQVHIGVEAGEIKYSAGLLHANPGDTIRWSSKQGPFAIEFAGISPVSFGGRRSQSGDRGHQLVGVVRKLAQPGVYRYACALSVNDEIYLDAGCPEIIIDIDL